MRSWNGLRFLLVILLFFALAGSARPVQAANVPCSASELIAAINAANASPVDDVIQLQAGCTYLLDWSDNSTAGGNGLPVIQAGAGSLTINGSGAVISRAKLSWIPLIMQKGATGQAISPASAAPIQTQDTSGSRDFRLLLVESGANLTLNDVTLQGGYLPEQNGGAILNEGTLLITSSTINDSQANIGGGIYNTGTLTVDNSTLSANSASASGGGISSGAGTLDVTNTHFNDNAAPLGDGLLIGGGSVVHHDTDTNIFNGDSQTQCPTFPHTVPPADSADLIQALQCANSTPANDVINLTSSTYSLTAVNNNGAGSGPTGLPVLGDAAVSGTLTIMGNGATIERSTSAPQFRIWRMLAGGDLTLDQVTIQNGSLPLGSVGGAIFMDNFAKLYFNKSTIANNSADYGGGIAGNDVAITLVSSTIRDNTSVHDGAGINMNGTFTISNSKFSGNRAVGNQVGNGLAGGLIITGGTLNVSNTTFSGNTSNAFAGGAGLMVFNLLGGVTNATISGCTFVGNTSQGGGSAIFTTLRTDTTLTNSTITGNHGQGTVVNNGVLTVLHSTISDNTGGGLANSQGTVSVGHTILSENGTDLSGAITSQGYNLIGNAGVAAITGDTTGNRLGVTAGELKLGALANNGGLTDTMALGTGSIAINAGQPGIIGAPTLDQRGSPRIAGGVIDIGAYESQ